LRARSKGLNQEAVKQRMQGDPEVVELFKKLFGADPLPAR
jgi:hypothetical protein